MNIWILDNHRRAALLFCVATALIANDTLAHHAPTEYDRKVIEIEGTLSEVRWQNPHVRIFVRVSESDSTFRVVEIEGGALSLMRRTNASPAGLKVGDRVKVAGNPSRRSINRMFGLNLLQADGREMVFQPGQPTRWQKDALGTGSNWFHANDLAPSQHAGIFRVWSSRLDQFLTPTQLPLSFTEAAKAKIAAWDLLADSATKGCEPIGMPTIMDAPYPIEFVRKGNAILLRFEIYDAVRTIHLDRSIEPEQLPKHLFGRSIGQFEGQTLVVHTDGILWPYLDHLGAPLSSKATVVERFTPAADGSRLEYSIVITDPEYLTTPLEMRKTLLARRGESVKPYECNAGETAQAF